MLCAVSHHHPRGRNDGAQKYYIVAALVPFLFVVHVEKFPIAAQLESVIEKLMLRLVARTISLYKKKKKKKNERVCEIAR
jgi:hypothetical protein